ncbi:ABC transporter permease [Paenibacillus septentrionalis]|uniref:ABC transporter permease n=1 Tax=Paenibacillus septentrionalis TaxID=429342 RepID=A0ABW1V0V7_9BACL
MRLPFFRFIFRKMWNTRWLTLSTLAGLIVAVAFATSIPMYADGALKRVIAKQLENDSVDSPAGSLLMKYQGVASAPTNLEGFQTVEQYIHEELPETIGFDYHTFVQQYGIRSSNVLPTDTSLVDASRTRTLTIQSMSGLQEHNELVQGQWFKDTVDGSGMIEAVMLEEGMFRTDVHIGDIYQYRIGNTSQSLLVKVVGAVTPNDMTDSYWMLGLESNFTTLFISEKVMKEYVLDKQKIVLQNAAWYYNFDLSQIQSSQINPLSTTLSRLDIELYQRLKDTRVDQSFASTLDQFRQQSNQLQSLLFTLAAPMLAMVFYFITMNAKQALDKQRSDIAVLRSRGAGTRQIVWMYVIESVMLGLVALIIGPLLGWFMSKSIGSADGFLSFVNRKSITIGFSTETIIAGLVAVFIAMLATIVPAIQYARASIVSYKQDLARSDKKPFWQKWFLDVVLVLVSAYGWYLFNERQLLTMNTGLGADEMQVQPFLFFVPAISIFAVGLVCLRIFPWILALFNWLGKKFLPVSLYLTLTQLSRSSKGYYPLMTLLILTIGLGVYNASAARTIDLNSTERTLYQYGTDVVIKTVWDGVPERTPSQQPGGGGGSGGGGNGGGGNGGGGNGGGGSGGGPGGGGPGGGGGGGGGGGNQPPAKILYSEPPFEVFRSSPGVEAAARVLQTQHNIIVSGKTVGKGTIMGIDNKDFSDVAWFGEDLYPVHPAYYLAYLGEYEHGAIVPQNIADRYQLKVGDFVSVAFTDGTVEFSVVGIVPFWPSLYPDDEPFIIANLDYIYDQLPLIPYEVWLKLDPDALVTPIVEKLQAANMDVASVKDVRNELIVQSKLPTRGGVFGILSLGFLVTVAITLAGYLLYWFFNLSGRVVQFGVLRAMGLSKSQLTSMLLLEQLFTAGLAIALGFGIGKLISYLFLPFLQTADSASKMVPPFRVVFESSDTNQLLAVVITMMLIGAALLFMHIRKLKVHQAVKMGEER